jgi:pimeloyl-ACP methyl ester carboxylesterase
MPEPEAAGRNPADRDKTEREATMELIVSTDGATIARHRSGAGPPLLLVHGTGADHTRWATIRPALEERFTVHALDRRGRGGSGDAAPYSIEREFDDVAAAVDAIGGPVDVLGHSYGALCALEAALRTDRVRKLALYEPPIPVRPGTGLTAPEHIAAIQARVDAGDRDGALEVLFRDVVGVPPDQIAGLRASPVWQARVAAAHTLARELRAEKDYVFRPERFANFRTPTLLLLGGDSPPYFKAATETVAAALPNGQVVVLPGQQHIAMNTAPELFLRGLIRFLADGEGH